jgi:hypothetical protein
MSEDGTERCFSDDEVRALASVLDEIIPQSGDGRLPAAGQIGIVAHIEQAVQKNPDLKPMISNALSALEDLARRRGAATFAMLARQDRAEVLNELSATEGAFVPTLTFYAYLAYYHDGRVLEGLGLGSRAPHPAGYDVEPDDLTLLDVVRRRGRLYRE